MADACRFQKNILRDAVRFCQCGVVVFLPSGVYFQYVPIANHIQRYLKACPCVIPHRSKETIGSTTTKKKTGNKRNKRQSIVFHRERERERERWKQSKNEGIWEEYRISLVLDAQHKDAGLALDQLESIERF